MKFLLRRRKKQKPPARPLPKLLTPVEAAHANELLVELDRQSRLLDDYLKGLLSSRDLFGQWKN